MKKFVVAEVVDLDAGSIKLAEWPYAPNGDYIVVPIEFGDEVAVWVERDGTVVVPYRPNWHKEDIPNIFVPDSEFDRFGETVEEAWIAYKKYASCE